MDEWTRWFEHDGTGCPVAGCYAQVVAANGVSTEGIIDPACARIIPLMWTAWIWDTIPIDKYEYRVVRYRIRKSKSILDLEQLIQEKELENNLLLT